MAENTGRDGGSGAGRGDAPDLIDDALRLVDTLQRRLLVAGVKRGVGAVTSPPPSKGDVWEEAIRLESEEERPPLEEVLDIVRRSAPEVAGHLGRAGLAAFDAFGRTWGVVERSLEQGRADAAGRREAGRAPSAAEPSASSPSSGAPGDGAPEAVDGQAGAGDRG
ncbi:hypothetical protein ACIRPH_21765 [Nocardiopsis sp. NPDC101807]|uniref:hypothetical protein n=1 Tax=Nocardiopsis sp. NPDC101807 TaxID=3364339 RepID=UPI003823F2C0